MKGKRIWLYMCVRVRVRVCVCVKDQIELQILLKCYDTYKFTPFNLVFILH